MSTVTAQRQHVARIPTKVKAAPRRTRIRTQIFEVLQRNDGAIEGNVTSKIAKAIGGRVQIGSIASALALMEQQGWVRKLVDDNRLIKRVDLVHMPPEFDAPVLELMLTRDRIRGKSTQRTLLQPPKVEIKAEPALPEVEVRLTPIKNYDAEAIVVDLIEGIEVGEFDEFIEAILTAGHDRKRALRRVWSPGST